MKKSYYSSLIALSFFAGTFLVAFSTGDSEMAAFYFVAYLVTAGVLAVTSSYWLPFVKSKFQHSAPAKIDHVLNDAERFSQEYGEVYVMADRLKQRKKLQKGRVASHG